MKKSIVSSQVAHLRYPSYDVLLDEEARLNRLIELKSAMAVTNVEREEIGVVVQLENGDEIEIISNLIDLEGDSIEVKGGHLIPISAILRVEI